MSASIGIVGSGNVATQLAFALVKANYTVNAIYSRNTTKAEELARKVGGDRLELIDQISSDVVFICVNDDQISNVSSQLASYSGLVIHTSGTVDIAALSNGRKGIFYPFQSIKKEVENNWQTTPILIESNSRTDLSLIERIAKSISKEVIEANSDARRTLHLTGVLMNNFTNHLASISHELLRTKGIDPGLLHPILDATIEKIKSPGPQQAQTGPAIRGDNSTIESHLELIKDQPRLYEIYKLLSESIQERS